MEQNSKKILIIDDDERNIFALSAVLKARKFECVAAANSAEGLKLLKQTPDVKVALIDMMMPDIDGYELMSIIRNEADIANIPIVAVTAQAMNGDKEKCLAAGADEYISKPVNIDHLLTVINKFINNSTNNTEQFA